LGRFNSQIASVNSMSKTGDPWILILIGAILVGLPMLLSLWEAGHLGKPGRLRDGLHAVIPGIDPATQHSFLLGLRIGVEAAGAILMGIGVLRTLGISI
jgi:hypothetical protein